MAVSTVVGFEVATTVLLRKSHVAMHWMKKRLMNDQNGGECWIIPKYL